MPQAKRPARKSLPDSPATPSQGFVQPLTWTVERQLDFAVALVINCSVGSVDALRNDPEKGEYLRLLWATALDLAYDRLEARLKSRASHKARTHRKDCNPTGIPRQSLAADAASVRPQQVRKGASGG